MARLGSSGRSRGIGYGGPARQASLREHNVSLVLTEILAATEPVSRADVAGRLGLARPTVSDLVDRLIAARMVSELPPVASRQVGRPAVPLVASSQGYLAYGLEINVNHLAVSTVDLTGAVLAEQVVTHTLRDAPVAEVVEQLAALAVPVVQATRGPRTVVGACVSVPGVIRHGTGTVQLAPNLGWHVADVVAALTAVPTFADWAVTMGNDADLGARAELAATVGGSASSASSASFVFLSGEVGLGGAVIIDGRALTGQHGWAGEIGHLCVDPDGPRCSCGATGCLEQYVGTEALLRAAGIADRVDGTDQVQRLVAALDDHDHRAAAAVAEAGRVLGRSLASMINIVDVDTVVLGGPLGRLHPYLAEPVVAELGCRVITAPWRELSVRAAASGQLGAARGGALTVLDGLVAHPTEWFGRPDELAP